MTFEERMDRLGAVIDRYRNDPFQWRVHDCCLFVARCVDAQCGTSYERSIYADFPSYDSPIAAIRVIQANGGFETVISRYLGAPVEVSELAIGDVVLARSPLVNSILLGIHDEEYIIAPDVTRLSWAPMRYALKGWKLPEAQV